MIIYIQELIILNFIYISFVRGLLAKVFNGGEIMVRIHTDEDIICGLKQRDIRIYEECIEKYKNYVGSVIVKQIGQTMAKEDVEEVVSDVFFAIWKQAERINMENYSGGSLKAYLAMIAKNMAINKLRQNSRLSVVSFDNTVYKDEEHNSDDYMERQIYENSRNVNNDRYMEPENYVEKKEHLKQVNMAIEKLGSPDSDIFVQYHYDGMTINQLSSKYGMNENTIKSKLSRSRKKLKKYFDMEDKNYESR